jgi:hypothetical protein
MRPLPTLQEKARQKATLIYRIQLVFYRVLHLRNFVGLQLSIPGIGPSLLDVFYEAAFHETMRFASGLIDTQRYGFDEVRLAMLQFYSDDAVGKLCDVKTIFQDAIAFHEELRSTSRH